MSEIKIPVLEVENKNFELKKVKPKQWREFFKFDSAREELTLDNMIDKHCEVIAEFFDVDANYLLENIEVADVLKIYHEIRSYLMQVVVSKLEQNSKNAETGDSQN